jgi:hypothetical protein
MTANQDARRPNSADHDGMGMEAEGMAIATYMFASKQNK